MPIKRTLLVKILFLNCFITDEIGFDDIFLMLNNEKIWPPDKRQQSVKPGRTSIDLEILNLQKGTRLNIEIWDYDIISSNDKLGIFPIHIDEPGGPFVTDMIANSNETDKAKYSIEWEIDFQDKK